MRNVTRLTTVAAIACAAALAFASVSAAKIFTQPINVPAGEITVNLGGSAKKKTIALLNLKYLCPTGRAEINSPRIAGLGKSKLTKKGGFTMKKANVKLTNPDTKKSWGKGTFVIKGRYAKGRLTGTATVRNKRCGMSKVKLYNGS